MLPQPLRSISLNYLRGRFPTRSVAQVDSHKNLTNIIILFQLFGYKGYNKHHRHYYFSVVRRKNGQEAKQQSSPLQDTNFQLSC